MKKQEINIDEFEILERLTGGNSRNATEPIITLAGRRAYLNRAATELIGVKNKDNMALAKRGDKVYICILPFDSTIKGYSVQVYGNNYSMFNVGKLEERGIPLGYYKVLEPIFVGEIDCFELELSNNQ